MGRERWFRGGHEGQERPFDWYTLAKERAIPVERARVLYEDAQRRARGHRGSHPNAEAIYVELLDAAHQEAWGPSPGKVTRTMRQAAERAGKRPGKRPAAPGKRTLTSYLDPAARARRDGRDGSQERERLDAIAGSFRAMGLAVPADLQRALARAGHTEPEGQQSHEASFIEESLPPMDTDTREGAARPLPGGVRTRMERAFGHDFSGVDIHLDSREVPAGEQAFTRGRDIHFGEGAFAPDTDRGDHVLAHELAHVVQQSTPSAARPPGAAVIPALEADAHQAAMSVLAGRSATVHTHAPAGLTLGFADEPEDKDAGETEDSPEDGYPEPMVGLHGELTTKAQGEKLPDNTTRESHHVPSVALAPVIASELRKLGHAITSDKKINGREGEGAGSKIYQKFAKTLDDAGTRINDYIEYKGGRDKNTGRNLSAILIHIDTHRKADHAAHSSKIARELRERWEALREGSWIIKKRFKEDLFPVSTLAGNFSTRPQKATWGRLIAANANHASSEGQQEFSPKESEFAPLVQRPGTGGDAEHRVLVRKSKKEINTAVNKSVQSAFILGMMALRIALKGNKKAGNQKDGDPDKHGNVLALLLGEMMRSWAKIRNPLPLEDEKDEQE